MLTVLALALIITVGANVTNLVPFYAIGVFTGFSMAGFGMARYHTRHKEPGWRRRRVINFSAGVLSALVVVIFAITKFTEGAWLVVVVGPILVFVLIRLNREYRMENTVLETIKGRQPPPPPHYARRTVLVFVDGFDLATLAALRYARSMRPTTLRAVHFVIDSARADKLRRDWTRADRGVVLEFVDCPDRRLARAAADLVCQETADPGTHVTVILPRRSYSPLLGRFLHDRTADKIARVVSQIPRSAATIIPYDVQSRVEVLHEREAERAGPGGPPSRGGGGDGAGADGAGSGGAGGRRGRDRRDGSARAAAAGGGPAKATRDGRRKADNDDYGRPVPSAICTPIGSLTRPGRATVEGRVHSVEIRPAGGSSVLACTVADSTGQLTALFYGRSHIAGVEPGARIRLTGAFGISDGMPGMINPTYELLSPP